MNSFAPKHFPSAVNNTVGIYEPFLRSLLSGHTSPFFLINTSEGHT